MTLSANAQDEKRTRVLISTEFGDMTLELYNDTPLHRDNFIQLIDSGFYDGSIFHRCIKNFMIQGGGAPAGKEEKTYTVPAEILPNHFHKKGALCAARVGDTWNPKRESSGTQFYIVQGEVFTNERMDFLEQRFGVKLSPGQRQAYTTVGGTPQLDTQYTVFGEVISGFEVIDKINDQKTGAADKPVQDIKMTVKLVD